MTALSSLQTKSAGYGCKTVRYDPRKSDDDDFSGSFNIVKPGVYDRKPDHGEHPDSYASVKKKQESVRSRS